jgi:hypothetical protein
VIVVTVHEHARCSSDSSGGSNGGSSKPAHVPAVGCAQCSVVFRTGLHSDVLAAKFVNTASGFYVGIMLFDDLVHGQTENENGNTNGTIKLTWPGCVSGGRGCSSGGKYNNGYQYIWAWDVFSPLLPCVFRGSFQHRTGAGAGANAGAGVVSASMMMIRAHAREQEPAPSSPSPSAPLHLTLDCSDKSEQALSAWYGAWQHRGRTVGTALTEGWGVEGANRQRACLHILEVGNSAVKGVQY